jgi:hypothetical protein
MIAIVLILIFGLATIFCYERCKDFLTEDVFYADAARSLLHDGYYGIGWHVETNQPPGLSALLALLFGVFGYSHAVAAIAIAVLETIAFLLTYRILRAHTSSFASTIICVLLLSSKFYFVAATRLVFPCFPYMAAIATALLSAGECERASSKLRKIAWSMLLAVCVGAALMQASAGISLLGAMLMVVLATMFNTRRKVWPRLRSFLPSILVGVAVQALWMHRTPAPLEWPLPGYPAPYLQQLRVKVGNHPELGLAKLRDIPERIFGNMLEQSDLLAELVLRHGVSVTKIAVVIAPLLAAGIGWVCSVLESGGTELLDWYFAGYEFIYLLWPWKLEARFLLPVAPFACLYIWKGLQATSSAILSKPRLTGRIWFPIGLILTLLGSHWIVTHWGTSFGDLPDELMVPAYLVSSVVAAWMAFTGRVPLLFVALRDAINPHARRIRSIMSFSFLGLTALLVGIGAAQQFALARENLSLAGLPALEAAHRIGESTVREIEAAQWIREHTLESSVIMARHLPTVYHYSGRKLIWFAPISNPEILLQGIRRHQVDYIVVIHHRNPYYLPDDDVCFQPLLAAHRNLFHIVFKDDDLQIFRFVRS